MLTVWDAGAGPPRTCWKLRSVELNVSDTEVTLRVTGMVTGLSATTAPPGPVAVIVMEPVYWPAARPVGITLTVRRLLAAVVPLWGATNNQLPVLLWKATV